MSSSSPENQAEYFEEVVVAPNENEIITAQQCKNEETGSSASSSSGRSPISPRRSKLITKISIPNNKRHSISAGEKLDGWFDFSQPPSPSRQQMSIESTQAASTLATHLRLFKQHQHTPEDSATPNKIIAHDVQSQLQKAASFLDFASREIEKSQKEVQHERRRSLNLEKVLKDFSFQTEEDQSKLGALEQKYKEAIALNETLKFHNTMFKQQLHALRQEVTSLREENAVLKQQNITIADELVKQKQKCCTLL